MTSQISLRRTGVVVFGARIGSIFTGLIFLVMMTRSLSAQQFGLYEVITDLVTFAAYPAGLVGFWATRDIARGKMFGKTAVLINMVLSTLGIVIYVGLAYFSASKIESASLVNLLFATLLVPIAYLNQAANAVVTGHKPIVMGYAVIFSEASKLAVAFPLLVVFKVGIDGGILAVMAANLAQSLASLAFAGDSLSGPVSAEQGKKWLTHSWLPMLTTLPLMFGIADTFVASIAASDTTLVGHYQAAFSVATLAGYSLYLASAMYPLLLRGGRDDLMAMTLDLALAFGIPMVVGAAVLANPILHLLNPVYADASGSLAILAVAALFITVASVFDQILVGRDRVDVNEDAKFGDYLKSHIFFVAKINIVLSLAYLVLVYASVAAGLAYGLSRSETIELWAVGQLAIFLASIGLKVGRVRSVGKISIPRSVGYYVVGGAIMAVVLYFLGPLISYGHGTFYLAFEILLVGGLGIGIYGAFVLAVDKNLREFLRKAYKEGI